MTVLSKHTLPLLTIAIAISLIAVGPAEAAKKGKGNAPVATIVQGAPVFASGQFASASAAATCPKGTQAVAGGFSATTPTPGSQFINLYESQRVGSRAWRVSGVQAFAATSSGLSAFAMCEPLKAKVKPRTVDVPLGAINSTVSAFAPCPRGSKVLSGGFSLPPANASDSALISRSIVGNGVGWIVDATRLQGAAAINVKAISYCADLPKIKTRSASTAVLGSTGAAQYASTPACPPKTSLRGGGFATSTPVNGLAGSALPFESRPVGAIWRSAAVPGGATAKSTLVTNSYCR